MGVVADLDVLLRNEPRSVCEQFVECLQAAEFGGSVLQAVQPALLSSSIQKPGTVLLHQVRAVVSSCSLCRKLLLHTLIYRNLSGNRSNIQKTGTMKPRKVKVFVLHK